MVKFLLIRFSSIGDIVLTTPVIRTLKQQVEDSQIHFLTKKSFLPVLEANPYIDKLFTLETNFNDTLKILKAENYDYIIDLHRNLRTMRVKNALHRFSFSFDKLNRQKWLLVNFKINRMPDRHIVDRYMDTARFFSVKDDGAGLDYFIPPMAEYPISKLHPEVKLPFVVIVVGGGHRTKQIPDDKLAAIIEGITGQVILLGGPADAEKAENIAQAVKNQNLLNLAGRLSINQSASVVKQAEVVLAPDTGLMHIAAAFRKTIFSVWGNTVPDFGMYPYRPAEDSKRFEVEGLKCRPCSKIGYKKCPKGHFKCMVEQDYRGIIIEINRRMSTM